jgi:hypothetical protein
MPRRIARALHRACDTLGRARDAVAPAGARRLVRRAASSWRVAHDALGARRVQRSLVPECVRALEGASADAWQRSDALIRRP